MVNWSLLARMTCRRHLHLHSQLVCSCLAISRGRNTMLQQQWPHDPTTPRTAAGAGVQRDTATPPTTGNVQFIYDIYQYINLKSLYFINHLLR